MSRQLHREDYTVGWVCALPVELAAALEMLDEEHGNPQRYNNDENIYYLGSVAGHNVVIVCLPKGRIGHSPAAAVATRARATFPGIQFGLMVGVGGGVPSAKVDIRLGDIVVSQPDKTFGGVIQYDSGKATSSGFERTGSLNSPPSILLAAVAGIQANELRGKSRLPEYIARLDQVPNFQHSKAPDDVLFKATYDHKEGHTCDQCNTDEQEIRKSRESGELVVHYGTIASGNQVIKNAVKRDKLSNDLGGVLCFEMEAAGLMNDFPCLVIRGIGDYADSHKNEKWQPYAAATAAAYAREVLSTIPPRDVADLSTKNEATRGTSVKWSDEERKCMQALRTSASDYEQFKDRNPRRVEDTCKWVLHHPNFQTWKDNSCSSLLWVSADPGCGKSTLSKSLVDIDLKPTDMRTTCYFFFKDDNDVQKSPVTALSALLHQLFYQKPMLIKHAMSEFAANGDRLPQLFYPLWNILKNAAGDPGAGEVCCVLDALDECTEGGRYKMISALSEFYQKEGSSNTTARLKICVTSRPYLDIERRFADLTSNFPTIRLLGEQESDAIRQEIDLVVRWRVYQLGSELKLNYSERSNLEKELLKMTHRTYLWLTLIFDIIHKMTRPTTRNLKAAIGTLPSTVHDAYEAILARVKEDDRQQAQKLLHIIVAATRPLTLEETNIALAIEDYHHSYDDLEQDLDDEARFRVTVRSLCGLFVTVVDQKVYLIHQTAKEFLVTKNEIVATSWKHSLCVTESENLLARICLIYIKIIEDDRTTSNTSMTAKYDYLDYAAGSWASHFRKAQHAATEQMLQLVLRVCDPHSQHFATWFNVYWNGAHKWEADPGFTSSLLVESYFGHATAVRVLLKGGADVDSRDEKYGRTPLLWAAMKGHKTVVKLLLEAGADVNSRDEEYGSTSLLWAAMKGRKTVVKLLLEAGADVDSRDNEYDQTPLWWATEKGNEAVVKLLLEAGADVDSRDEKYGRTPLWWAAEKGNETLVKLLLEAGADVDSRDEEYGRTPLSWAVKNGNETMVKLLLEAGADVDSRDKEYDQTPLSRATEKGNEAVVKLLLEAGAGVDSRDEIYGRTPLWWAAKNGNETLVKLLLEAGADVDSRDNEYGLTPMWWAANNGNETMVKLLLMAGADVDSRDEEYGRTSLWWATKNGNETVVKLLLEAGADVDSRDNEYDQTPLWWATEKGNEAVVKLLLEAGADVDSRDNQYGRTPLWWAAKNGTETVVKLLLEAGADVDSRDKEYGLTPLSWAAMKGHKTVVKLLLKAGVDFDSRYKEYGLTPLSWAAMKGRKTVVKLLLEAGADVDSRDEEYGRTPLWWAAEKGNETLVKLLLEAGADVDSRDNEYGLTPMWWAANNGNETMVKLLLEAGADVDSRDEEYDLTPMWWAAKNGNETVVKLLLEAGADVDSRDEEYGWTPLWWAAKNRLVAIVELLLEAGADVDSRDKEFGWTPMWWAAKNGNETVVKLLLEAGADVDSRDKEYGRTPLSWVGKNRLVAMVKLLLEAGANVDLRDEKYGRTPLSWAAWYGHKVVVKLLLKGGADIDSRDMNGRTPLWQAAAYGHAAVVKLLLEGRADVDLRDDERQTPLLRAAANGHVAIVKLLLEGRADIDSRDKEYGHTPLSWAAEYGHEVVVKLLLDRRADVDSRDEKYGRTALSWAAWYGHEAVVKLLLEGRADVNSRDMNGRTPLWLAAAYGHETVVKLLLEGKADIDSRDDEGQTPLLRAAEYGHVAVVKLLKSFSHR